jgi:hypothetical protein
MAGYIGSKAVNLSTTGADINGNANIDGDLSFRDNDKAIFGAGSDLQIYHDGSNSIIEDTSTGNLQLITNGNAIALKTSDGEAMLSAIKDGDVKLYYNNALKLATTSTGVDITGVLTSNKVTIDNGLADGGELLLASQGYNSWQLDNSAGSVRFIYDGKVPYQINGPSDAFIWRSSTSANTERMRIDASGNLLVGTTLSPTSLSSTSSEEGMAIGGDGLVVIANDGQSPLVLNRLSSDGNILNFNKDGTTVGSIGAKAGDLLIGTTQTSLRFNDALDVIHPFNQTSGSSSDANTDLGASSARFKDLYLSGNIAASNSSSLQFGSTSCAIEGTSSGADYIKITTNSSEAMRIDSSGKLLVGKTSDDNTAIGLVVNGNGYTKIVRASATANVNSVLSLNRLTSDGTIIDFQKDGTSVGYIGNIGGNLYIGAPSASGLFFGGTRFQPMSDGSLTDNLIDMGHPSYRFDDIYATNTSIIGTSDKREKQDIAELDEAEQRVAVACKGLLRKFRWKDAVAKKGDDARIHFGIIAQDLQAAFAAEGLDAARYGMFIHNTWWEHDVEVPAVEAVAEVLDEEGNVVTEAVEAKDAYTRTDTYETQEEAPEGAVERDRMGVRMTEILAFIIGAL